VIVLRAGGAGADKGGGGIITSAVRSTGDVETKVGNLAPDSSLRDAVQPRKPSHSVLSTALKKSSRSH